MRIGEVVGGVALVGVAVLVAVALTDDPTPDTITADTSPFVFAASTSPAPSSTETTRRPTTTAAGATTDATPATTDRPTTAAAPATTARPTTAATPATVTATTAAPPALIPREQRAAIAVRVLNGGAPARAATTMSEALRSAGFTPGGTADAVRRVAETSVLFAPGRELDAATVNDLVRARPENVVAVPPDDPNWAEFGDGLTVLVVLGPAGT